MGDIRAVKLRVRCNRCQRDAAHDEPVGTPCGAEMPPLVLRPSGTCRGMMNVSGYPLHDTETGWRSWHDQQVVVPGD